MAKPQTKINPNSSGPVAQMVSLTPLMAQMAEAAGLDLLSGRFKESSPAGNLTAQWQTTHAKYSGSGHLTWYSTFKRNQHPLEPGLLELVGLFFLPWATAFISDLAWPEVKTLANEISDYAGRQELMYLEVALAPVRKWGGLQNEPTMPALKAICERKGYTQPLHGWHALACGVAVLHYALPSNVRDPKTGEPSTQFESWLWRVPRDKDATGRYWETPGRWFQSDGKPSEIVVIQEQMRQTFKEAVQQVRRYYPSSESHIASKEEKSKV